MSDCAKGRARVAKWLVAAGMALPLSAGMMTARHCPAQAQAAGQEQEAGRIEALWLETGRLLEAGRAAEAEPVARAALAAAQRAFGERDPRTAMVLNRLASVLLSLNRLDEAGQLFLGALRIREQGLPPDHPDIALSLNNLATVLSRLNRLEEAERLHRRALAISEQALPPDHPDIALSLNNLARALLNLNRLDEAERLLRRALTIWEQALPENHPGIAESLDSLASVLERLDRLEEAERLHRRALAIRERALPPDHPDTARSLNNLGVVANGLDRPEEAALLHRDALAIRERVLPPNHPDIAASLNNLASVSEHLHRLDEAERLLRRALAIWELALPENHLDIALGLSNIAMVLEKLDRLVEAEQFHRRSLAIRERVLPGNHPLIAEGLEKFAYIRGRLGALEEMLAISDRAARIRAARENRAVAAQHDWRHQTLRHIRTAEDLLRRDGSAAAALVHGVWRATFFDLQWERSGGAGGAIAAAMTRALAGDPQVAPLARERDRLLDEIGQIDDAFLRASSSADLDRETRALRLADLRARSEDARERLAAIDSEIAARFPAFAELADGPPLAVEDLLPLLEPDEVLVSVTPYGSGGFFHAYDRNGGGFTWLADAGDAAALAARLRCSAAGRLDPSCRDAAVFATAEAASLPDTEATMVQRGAVPLRAGRADAGLFDLALAHDLYDRLFPEEARGFLRGKKLIIAPAPELMGLPWHLLVTEPPPEGWDAPGADRAAAYRDAAWLFQSHPAITVLPAISSLRALRRAAPQRQAADRAFLGVGDPVVGRSAAERDAPPMECGPRDRPVLIAGADPAAGFIARSAGAAPAALFSGDRDREGFALADPESVRVQPRLADTRCEIEAIAGTFGAWDGVELLLDADATEARIRDLDEASELGRYRVLHFATHGLISGELGLGEPGLVLTPPAAASPRDDGVLTAGEIATLTLSADWVILSACNTAAGSEADAEALSGLARSFFYAGAKSILVSSWPVYSPAAVEITTGAFAAMEADPQIGRAEALTLAMRSTLEAARTEHTAHPAYWGPFFFVGEGA